jgi:hypothetical protein
MLTAVRRMMETDDVDDDETIETSNINVHDPS